jgi:hypothetical protein
LPQLGAKGATRADRWGNLRQQSRRRSAGGVSAQVAPKLKSADTVSAMLRLETSGFAQDANSHPAFAPTNALVLHAAVRGLKNAADGVGLARARRALNDGARADQLLGGGNVGFPRRVGVAVHLRMVARSESPVKKNITAWKWPDSVGGYLRRAPSVMSPGVRFRRQSACRFSTLKRK